MDKEPLNREIDADDAKHRDGMIQFNDYVALFTLVALIIAIFYKMLAG